MKKVFIVILCVLFVHNINSQSVLDSLLNVQYEQRDTNLFDHYTQVIVELFYSDLELSREYVDKQMKLADELKDPARKAFSDNINAVYYSNISEYAKAKDLFIEVMESYKKMGNLERVSAILNNIAICNQNLGHLELALENQMESLRIKDSIGVAPAALAASYWNISNIFFEIVDIPQSNAYIRKAMVIYEELGDERSVYMLKDLLSSNYITYPDSLEKAKSLIKECLNFYKKENQYNDLGGAYSLLGSISVKQENYKEAEEWFLKALEIAESGGEKKFPGLIYRRLSIVYNKQEKYAKALPYALKSLQEAQELGLTKKEINDHLELASIYAGLGDYEKALESHVTYHAMNDSILGNEKVLAMTELEKKYQTEKKEQEIIILQEQKKSAKLRQIALLLSIAALCLIMIALWSYFFQKAKRSKVEKEKLDQEIEFKTKDLESKKQELTVFALQLAQKNELLENLKLDIQGINKDNGDGKTLQSLINTIQFNQNDEEVWESFKSRFEQVHVGFNKRILDTYPSVTTNDLRIISLIKMNLSSKEIANILNISQAGIKKARYRLRKKLNLNNEDNLDHLIVSF